MYNVNQYENEQLLYIDKYNMDYHQLYRHRGNDNIPEIYKKTGSQ